jgi:hypothetical protein
MVDDLGVRLLALLPPEAVRQLVVLLEEYQRRAGRGHGVPKEISPRFFLDGRGRVLEVEIPRRYGCFDPS